MRFGFIPGSNFPVWPSWGKVFRLFLWIQHLTPKFEIRLAPHHPLSAVQESTQFHEAIIFLLSDCTSGTFFFSKYDSYIIKNSSIRKPGARSDRGQNRRFAAIRQNQIEHRRPILRLVIFFLPHSRQGLIFVIRPAAPHRSHSSPSSLNWKALNLIWKCRYKEVGFANVGSKEERKIFLWNFFPPPPRPRPRGFLGSLFCWEKTKLLLFLFMDCTLLFKLKIYREQRELPFLLSFFCLLHGLYFFISFFSFFIRKFTLLYNIYFQILSNFNP